MEITASEIISRYGLQPHPEGGFYKETYRSPEFILKEHLPRRFGGERRFSTAICFLLTADSFSAFHKIKSDELWHYYEGGSLLLHILHINGRYELIRMGKMITEGEVFQAMVPAGSWFAAECAQRSEFSFVGCTVSPGFEFADFELAAADELIKKYPAHTGLIRRLTR
jgi:hypothetical protein